MTRHSNGPTPPTTTPALHGATWAHAELRKILKTIGANVVDRELALAHAHQQSGGAPGCSCAIRQSAGAPPRTRQLDRAMVFEKGHNRRRFTHDLPRSPWPVP